MNSPFRFSDHDPSLIALNFRTTVTATLIPSSATSRLQVLPSPTPSAFNIRIAGADARSLTLEVLSVLEQPVLAMRGTTAEKQAELARRTATLAPHRLPGTCKRCGAERDAASGERVDL